MIETYSRQFAWAIDLARAVICRPWWARILFWLALGESGRHEFWGLVWACAKVGSDIRWGDCGWRSDLPKMPLRWWTDKAIDGLISIPLERST